MRRSAINKTYTMVDIERIRKNHATAEAQANQVLSTNGKSWAVAGGPGEGPSQVCLSFQQFSVIVLLTEGAEFYLYLPFCE